MIDAIWLDVGQRMRVAWARVVGGGRFAAATASPWAAGEGGGSAAIMVVLACDRHANGVIDRFPPILGFV